MIRVHPEAHAESAEAHLHYLVESAVAAERFKNAVLDGYAKAAATPLLWPQDDEGFRRYKLPAFPYLIFYEVLPDGIHVFAVAHGARKPRYWRDRAGR
ncbi:MAG: type II toxin-antitoxin system RelE/ParE family toxin [Candidatus Brocadiae bacterium]|nr:type II toxin-antitoxin system RelE/ParE family toxin [Candidatus Brocadiia bacterium]